MENRGDLASGVQGKKTPGKTSAGIDIFRGPRQTQSDPENGKGSVIPADNSLADGTQAGYYTNT